MRKIETICVRSVEDFLPEIISRPGFKRAPIYRGHASSKWDLLPTLFRKNIARTEFSSWADLEGTLMMRFKQEVPKESLIHKPTSELEWISVAQFNGLPTRFSTWSENALVALYFATATEIKLDGVVWRIYPKDSNLTISYDYEQIPEVPCVYIPQKNSHEILNQKICFLSHPLPAENAIPISFEDEFELSNESFHLTKIIIPFEEKNSIRKRLASMGMDNHALFPNIKGLCNQIQEDIYSHSDAYDWIIS